MLGRILKRPSAASSTPFPFPLRDPGPGPSPPPFPPNFNTGGRKLDISFNKLFLKPTPQLTILATISRVKRREKIRKAEYKKLPATEKRRLYLESRPMKKKLLDWVGSKSQALVRTMGTVDAWAGPMPKNASIKQIASRNIGLLESGQLRSMRWRLSDRTNRVMQTGMIISTGALMGWLTFSLMQNTKAEGPLLSSEPETKKKKSNVLVEDKEKRPGVFVWGSNRGDVTAPGSKDDFVKSATRLAYFDGRALRDLALSNDLGVAVDERGDVIQWGRAFSHMFIPEPTLKGKNITQVAISDENVICLSNSGKVYVLPASKSSLLSGPKPTESSWIPFWSSISEVSYTFLSLPEKITHIAAGDDHFLLLSRSGKVFSGASTVDGNTFGQLGVETSPGSPNLTPYHISSLGVDPISAIAVGERHSLALTSRGEVYSWGSNAQGQLLQQYAKDNFATPTPTLVPLQRLIPGIQGVQGIAAGGANSFVVANVNDNVEVYASGSGMWGQLGSGVWNQIQHRPVRVKTIQGLTEWSEQLRRKINIGIRYMSVGENHVAAVLDNDVSAGVGGRDAYIWGCGEAYQLGHGKRNNLNIPSQHNPLATAEGRLAELNDERFMLKPRRKVEVVSADGGRKMVVCEETIVLGGGCSAIYEKIVS